LAEPYSTHTQNIDYGSQPANFLLDTIHWEVDGFNSFSADNLYPWLDMAMFDTGQDWSLLQDTQTDCSSL
jgi:hypothetical protein